MADKQTSLQDLFLNALRRTKTPITMFLVKGVKLQGIVTSTIFRCCFAAMASRS